MHLHITNSTIHLSILPPGLIASELGSEVSSAVAQPLPTTMNAGTPPTPGEYWTGQGGRFICTLPALQGAPARHLIAGEQEIDDLTYGPAVEVAGATNQVDGVANTAALLAHAHKHPAAQWAAAYTADGHTDFHLPSRLDLLMAYICAPQLSQKSGWYWSSTQGSRHFAFVQDFAHGGSVWYGKGYEHRVRAFRWIRLDPLNA